MRGGPGPGWKELESDKGLDVEMAARSGGAAENGKAAAEHCVDERPSTSSSAGGSEAQVGYFAPSGSFQNHNKNLIHPKPLYETLSLSNRLHCSQTPNIPKKALGRK